MHDITLPSAPVRAQYLQRNIRIILRYSCVAIKSNILAMLKISVSVVSDNSANFATIIRSSEAFVSKHKKYVAQYTIAALRRSTFDFNDISCLAFLVICSAFKTPLCV